MATNNGLVSKKINFGIFEDPSSKQNKHPSPPHDLLGWMASGIWRCQDPMGGSVDEDGKSLGEKVEGQVALKKLAAFKKMCEVLDEERALGYSFSSKFDKDLWIYDK